MILIMISHLDPPLTQAQLEAFICLYMLVACTNHGFVHMGLHAQNHRLKPWFCAHGFIHLFPMEYCIWKENIQNLKHLVVALVVCQLIPILEVQGSNLACTHCMQSNIFLGLSFTFITCAYIYDSHLVPIVIITPFTLHLLLVVFFFIQFSRVADNLHDNVLHLFLDKCVNFLW